MTNMFYQLGRHVFVRNINHSMLLWDKYTDNRIIGDEIAFVFAKSVTYQPKAFESIIDDIVSEFSGDIDRVRIQDDAFLFYAQLESAGIIFSGESEEECRRKASSWRYNYNSSIRPLSSDSHQEELMAILKQPALIQIMVEITITEHITPCNTVDAANHSTVAPIIKSAIFHIFITVIATALAIATYFINNFN